MNPPKRIYMTQGNHGVSFDTEKTNIDNISNENYLGGGPYIIFTYTLEEKEPMEQKEMTAQDAWVAMARGECVKCGGGDVRRITDSQVLRRWDSYINTWELSATLGQQPYSIVPDPSKPVAKQLSDIDELMIEFAEFVDEEVGGKYEPEQDLDQSDLTRLMLTFINQKFQRKEAKS